MIVLSTSAVSSYLRCHYQYALGYVYRLRGAQNMAAAIGTAVHSGIEAAHKSLPAEDALRASFEEQMASVPISEAIADPDALPDALRMLRVYQEEVMPTFHPTLIEAPFTAKVAGVILSGILDGADEDVRDTKTTAGKTINGRKPSSFTPASYDLQLSIYALGYKALTGKLPRRLLLDVLTRRGTYRQYERPMKIGEAVDTLGIVRDGIDRGDFDPTGAYSGACRWCQFAATCKYAVTD